MTETELHALIERLCAESHETAWLEFKANRHEPQELGEYLSALANSACLHGKPKGYLCFGIENQSHAIVGTDFDPERSNAKGNQPLLIWLGVGLQPNVGFEHFVTNISGKRVVLFAVNPSFDRPVKFYGEAFVRVGSSKTTLAKHPEKERAIWARRVGVMREALHNCIAHQDYGMNARINVVEFPDRLLFTNQGSFLPGTVEAVILQDSPTEVYRNPFLAEAMVNLNMIDTQGGGIKRMFTKQAQRFFPLPDYDLHEANRVAVTICGTILDERYTRLLMQKTDLGLQQVILLDKVQKRIHVSKEAAGQLRRAGLVEGRYPTLFVSGKVAEITGSQAQHIRERGFDNRYYRDLLLELIREHGPLNPDVINELFMEKLPDVLTDDQKRAKIRNLTFDLAHRRHLIQNVGSARGKGARWQIRQPQANSGPK
jgi:ATP-dependent DNA helicase RecG